MESKIERRTHFMGWMEKADEETQKEQLWEKWLAVKKIEVEHNEVPPWNLLEHEIAVDDLWAVEQGIKNSMRKRKNLPTISSEEA